MSSATSVTAARRPAERLPFIGRLPSAACSAAGPDLARSPASHLPSSPAPNGASVARKLDNLAYPLHGIVHRHLQDGVSLFDGEPRHLGGFIGRKRCLGLSIHLKAKLSDVRALALLELLLRRLFDLGAQGLGPSPLSRCHSCFSSGHIFFSPCRMPMQESRRDCGHPAARRPFASTAPDSRSGESFDHRATMHPDEF